MWGLTSRRRWLRVVLFSFVVFPGSFIVLRWLTGNEGSVLPSAVYRSAQRTPEGLQRAIQNYGIRTVVNLRGYNPDKEWYRGERTQTRKGKVTQVDLAMASDQWLSRAQMRVLLDVLQSSERPVLIHCEWGAERTGLASALCALMQPGSELSDGYSQFSPFYLYLPLKDGRTMRAHVDQYRHWLEARNEDHSPEALKRWAAEGYRPGKPTREDWPYDPYPLVVTTNPAGQELRGETKPREKGAGALGQGDGALRR